MTDCMTVILTSLVVVTHMLRQDVAYTLCVADKSLVTVTRATADVAESTIG